MDDKVIPNWDPKIINRCPDLDPQSFPHKIGWDIYKALSTGTFSDTLMSVLAKAREELAGRYTQEEDDVLTDKLTRAIPMLMAHWLGHEIAKILAVSISAAINDRKNDFADFITNLTNQGKPF